MFTDFSPFDHIILKENSTFGYFVFRVSDPKMFTSGVHLGQLEDDHPIAALSKV